MGKVHDVAEAIYHAQYANLGGNFEFVEQRHKETVWYPMARAAIDVMREPTEHMKKHANHMSSHFGVGYSGGHYGEIYRHMIDAALSDG